MVLKLVKCYIWNIALYGAATWAHRKVDGKYLESCEMWSWRPSTSYVEVQLGDRVRNVEVLHRVKEDRNILHTTKRRKTNWFGHILRIKCLLKHVTEEKIEGKFDVTGRRGRRRKLLLDDLRKREDTGNRKRKQSIELCRGLALEKATDLS
jgi:hypothetical protein